MYAKIQICRCPTYHTKRVVLIRSLRRRPYRMKPTAVGFISLTTVRLVNKDFWIVYRPPVKPFPTRPIPCHVAPDVVPSLIHDDVIKWKYFPRYWPLVWGIHRSPANSPHIGQWHGALVFSLICAWRYGWVNNREAGDLRCHRTQFDVTVMITYIWLTELAVYLVCIAAPWENMVGFSPSYSR